MTAAELLAQLARDPEHQRREAEWSASVRQHELELRDDERGLLGQLRKCGLRLDSVADLIGRDAIPSEVATILIKHLHEGHLPPIHDGIARALASAAPGDRGRVRSALMDALAKERVDSVRDAIILTIGQIAGPAEFDELVRLLQDPATGDARVLLLSAFRRLGEPGREVLAAMTSDPSLGPEARDQLRGAADRHQSQGDVLSNPGGELISIALDRLHVDAFLEEVAAALGVPVKVMNGIAAQVDSMRTEQDMSVMLAATDGSSFRLEVFVDDADAIDIAVFGPKRFGAALERSVERFARDPGK